MIKGFAAFGAKKIIRKSEIVALKTKYLKTTDMTIAYAEYGKGPVLLLLHGNSENKNIFKKYQKEYFADFHTYAIDSRGHGQSSSEKDVLSIEQFSKDIQNFCHMMDIKEANVIGYSDGGNVALFLGLNAPGVFRKIVTISPNYLASGTSDYALKGMKQHHRILLALKKIGFNMDKSISRLHLMLNDIGLSKEDLNNIKARILIIYAENDLIKEEHIKELGNEIPGASMQKIYSCNHFTVIRNKKAINTMRGFLMH